MSGRDLPEPDWCSDEATHHCFHHTDWTPKHIAQRLRASSCQRKTSRKVANNTKAAEGPKTTAEKDLEFKKRQQEAKEKADKQAKEQAAEAEKRDNCERAKRNLAALENNQPMVTLDENGQRKVMDTTQREQEMERARRFMAESCK